MARTWLDKAFEVFAKRLPIEAIQAEVLEVDEAARTCKVRPLNLPLPDISQVRLDATVDEARSAGELVLPEVGSVVTCLVVARRAENLTVVKFSAISKKTFDAPELVFNGGANGGLLKGDALVAELNKALDRLEAIADTLESWTPVPNDGGAALKTAITAALAGKAPADYSQVQDDRITT